jgi:DNA-binding Lrp family transcriptional regulator
MTTPAIPDPERIRPLTGLEARVLECIQGAFPLESDPYAAVALQVGCSRAQALGAVRELRRRKIIRRIGGSFASSRLGYVSALVAARIQPEQLIAVAIRINRYAEVTHNYERDGVYNLWFTVIAATEARLAAILADVRTLPGVEVLEALPAVRTFKLRVEFAFEGDTRHAG